MKLSTFAIIVTILAMGFGLAFLFIPAKLAGFYGGNLAAGGILMARYFGAANLFIGLIFWSYSSVSPSAKSWPKLLLYSFVYDVVQFIITLMAMLNKELIYGLGHRCTICLAGYRVALLHGLLQ